jgi:hypothetical protein
MVTSKQINIAALLLFFLSIVVQTSGQNILDSVVINADKVRVGSLIYTPDKSKIVVSVTGEQDILKYISKLPGVSSGIEGSSSMFVRGGNNGNNKIMLDGVPFYDCSHLLGLVSLFSGDIIDVVSFRKGGQSSSMGDYSASLTELSSKNKPFGTSASISPFFAGVNTSGYISKKAGISYIFSARHSLTEALWGVSKEILSTDDEVQPHSGDIYLKLGIPVNSKNLIFVGGYYSDDDIKYSNTEVEMKTKWGNKMGYIIWESRPAKWIKWESEGYYSNYSNSQNSGSFLREGWKRLLSIDENIEEYSFRSEARININRFSVLTGGEIREKFFNCGSSAKQTKDKFNSFSLFSDLEYKHRYFTFTGGIRHTIGSFNVTDLHLDLCSYIGKCGGLELTYDKMYQLFHLTEGGLVGWRDFLVPATDSLPPEFCSQIYAGGFVNYKSVKAAIGAYYKEMNNLTSFESSSDLFLADFDNWNQILLSGSGKSYGIEVSVEIEQERYGGSLSYTLSKTDRQYDGINNGGRFPFQYDRRHILNFQGHFSVTEKKKSTQSANINISYTSGGFSTLPVARCEASALPYIRTFFNDGTVTEETEENLHSLLLVPGTNGFLMPYYFRVDLGYSFTWKRDHSSSELTVGLCNIFNRHNASLIFYNDGLWQQLCIVPFMPSISLRISFS